jgi:hypothetical protein
MYLEVEGTFPLLAQTSIAGIESVSHDNSAILIVNQ